LYALVRCYARKHCELRHKRVSVMPGWIVDLEENEVTPSQGAVVEAEIRPAHAPAAERNMRRQR
jgi:hypothetical protein